MNPKRILTFVRGTDGACWCNRWDGNQWSDWFSLGGQLATPYVHWRVDPKNEDRIDVFVQGLDTAMWHRWSDDGGLTWQPADTWESRGGSMNGPIQVI